MGYMYRIYEKDRKGFRPYVPKNFTEKNANELLYFDYLTCLMENERVFKLRWKKDHPDFKDIDIAKITIGLKEAESFFEYKVIFKNPYIENLLRVENKTFLNIKANDNSEKEIDKMTIDTNTKAYDEMRNYLFKFLQDKDLSDIFFKKIFRYKNSFKELLRRYSVTYLSSENTNEDIEEIGRLRREIEGKLKEYKNFRVLAVTRYEYELKIAKKNDNNEEERKELDIDDYNKECEEFLDEKEFNEMTGGDDNKVLIPRR